MSALFKSSRVFLLFALASLLQGTFAHTYLSSLFLGDQALGVGDCMRAHPSTAFDYPIPTVDDASMTCGWLPEANRKANRKCPVAAGSKIGMQWYHNSASPSDDIVEATHLGPIMVYMAKSEDGLGNVWFKIYEDGFSDGKWAVEKLIANRGRVDFTLPADIAPGNYLLRGEILALHGAYDLNGVQPYVGCAELTISGNGNANPTGVAMPGFYKNTDPGMLFNRYSAFTSYPIPGPAVYKSGSSPAPSSSGSTIPSNPTTTPVASATSRPTPPADTTNNNNNNNNVNNNNNNIKVGLSGTNVWWVGAIVSGGAETTVKVEMMDSGLVKNWVAMKDDGYAYTYTNNIQFVLPISLRVTSSTGKQVVLTNVFNSFANSLIDTGKTYAGSPSAPVTSAPTNKPVSTPAPQPTTGVPSTGAPSTGTSTGNAKITLRAGATEWWFGMTVNSANVASVEIKDSASYSTFKPLASNTWGQETVFTFQTTGAPLVVPISVKVTSKSGKVATATISSFASGSVIEASGSL